jgi:hypothetical protein
MNIMVLIKQVPNTTEVKLDPKTGNLIREGVETIIKPCRAQFTSAAPMPTSVGDKPRPYEERLPLTTWSDRW